MPKRRLSINSILPSLFTLASCCAGLTAVRFAIEGDIQHALLLILASAILDGLDGTVARWLKATSTFGGELDSLADFVAFGVSPALIVYFTLFHSMDSLQSVSWAIALIFAMCCGLRLARFNVANFASEEIKVKSEPFFRGIPAPAGGMLALMPMALFNIFPEITDNAEVVFFMLGWLLLIGGMMVSSIPTFSPKKIRISRSYRIPFILFALCLILLAFEKPWHVWVAICGVYFLSIPILALRLRRLGNHA